MTWLKRYLLDKKTKAELNSVLKFLYSKKTYNLNELISTLKNEYNSEEFEFYIIILCATTLEKPYTQKDLLKIYKEKIKVLEDLAKSKESGESAIEILQLQANLAMLHFNRFFRLTREGSESTRNLPCEKIYSALIEKKGPLSEVDIKAMDTIYSTSTGQDFKITSEYKSLKNLLYKGF
jgi:hypothetical protein